MTMAQTLPAAIARTIACRNTHTLSSSARSRLARFSPSRPHPFSTTAPALSRGKKPSPGSGDRDAAPVAGKKSRDGGSGAGAADPLDLSPLEAAIARTLDWLKRQIAEGRNGGKNAAAIEGLRVTMPKGGELKLGDVAQVVTRNRVLVVLVADKEVFLFFGFLMSVTKKGRKKGSFPNTCLIVVSEDSLSRYYCNPPPK